MSSEAAQKAFADDGLHTDEEVALKMLERMAFDRGAVEALRQAADMMRSARDGETPGPHWIERMADNWEVGQ